MKMKQNLKFFAILLMVALFVNMLPMTSLSAYAESEASIRIVNRPYQLYTGDTYTFHAVTDNGEVKDQLWHSSDKSVATIDASTGMLIAKQAGKTKIVVKDKSTGKKAWVTIRIKDAKKTEEAFVNATYLSGLELDSITGDSYTTKEDAYIDTTRFVLYLEQGVTIPTNLVQSINYIMNLIESKTQLSFNSYKQNETSNTMQYLINSTSPAATKVKEILTKENKLFFYFSPTQGGYSYSNHGCVINTSTSTIKKDEISNDLIDMICYLLVDRSGIPLRSCLTNAFSTYYKEVITKEDPLFVPATGYASLEKYIEKVDPETVETLFLKNNVGDSRYKLGYRFMTYLIETYGDHVFSQFRRSINQSHNLDLSVQEELDYLKLNFSETIFTDFCEWYHASLQRFGDEDLSVYGDWYIDQNNFLLKYLGNDTVVSVPETVFDIQPCAFSHNETIVNVVIPSTTKAVSGGAFYGCTNLKEIRLPEGITTIFVNTFEECSSLQAVVLPSTLTKILSRAFYHCPSLTSIVIPESVTQISDDAFDDFITIYGVKGSTAESFAKQHNYTFIEL